MSRCTNGPIDAALRAFASAETKSDYSAAKRLAAKCDPVSQLAMVDSIIAARKRVWRK